MKKIEKVKNGKKGENYKFFSHKECEYFPCHKYGKEDDFNCLFCYCPLYTLGSRCGGNFRYLENGIKDCSNCILPHKRENYEYIIKKYDEIRKIASRENNNIKYDETLK